MHSPTESGTIGTIEHCRCCYLRWFCGVGQRRLLAQHTDVERFVCSRLFRWLVRSPHLPWEVGAAAERNLLQTLGCTTRYAMPLLCLSILHNTAEAVCAAWCTRMPVVLLGVLTACFVFDLASAWSSLLPAPLCFGDHNPAAGRYTTCVAVCVDVVFGRTVPDVWLSHALHIIQTEPALNHYGSGVTDLLMRSAETNGLWNVSRAGDGRGRGPAFRGSRSWMPTWSPNTGCTG